jgi:hypothetical protein
MSIYKHHIVLDRTKPFSANLANAINEYWRERVAIPDGTHSAYEGNVSMKSINGIPTGVKKYGHPAIIRVRRGHGNRWLIVDQEE